MPRLLSLFTGAGGLDLGLHAAGFRAAALVESDSASIATLTCADNAAWWADTAIFPVAIEDVTSDRLLGAAGASRGEIDLLVGGPPCQPFSKSGYWHSGDSKRLADPRANTLQEYLRVLEDALPECFLVENVPGLAFSEKDDGLELLRSEVDRINRRHGTRYSLNAAQLNAADYGVPQVRERVFIIGHRDGREFVFPKPTHQRPPSVDMSNGNARVPIAKNGATLKFASTAWDALAGIPGTNDPSLAVRGKWADLLPSIPEGHNYLYHTNRGGGLSLFGWRRRYWSMLLKLAKNRPSWTLTAQPGPAIGPFHWDNRRLSAREMSALQTFPAKYRIVGSVSLATRQLGNAVPSALAEILGLEIRRQLLDESVKVAASLLPRRRRNTPDPEPIAPVPEKYLDLVDEYSDHPGTGKGFGAKLRVSA